MTAFSDIDGPSLLRKIGWSARCEVLFYYGGQEATTPDEPRSVIKPQRRAVCTYPHLKPKLDAHEVTICTEYR